MKLPRIQISKLSSYLASTSFLLVIFFPALLFFTYKVLKTSIENMGTDLKQVKEAQENLSMNFSEELFQDHLSVIENIKAQQELKTLELDLEELKATKQGAFFTEVDKVYDLYLDFQAKIKRNNNAKLDTKPNTAGTSEWGTYLLEQNFDTLESSLSAEIQKLDDSYKKYLATLPPPVPTGGGYSYSSVSTERGTFGVYLIKVAKSSVRVKTVAAIEDDCKDNCATKSLAQYASENGAYAGMTGSYACPADYSQCAGKVWSFDFALYDSNDGKWLNKKALTWNETGLITFNGNSSKFYEDTSKYDGDGVTAGVSNFPALLENGNIEVDSGDIDSYQNVKGLRGAIGTDDKNIYLAYITGASVIDAGYVMRALGAKDALNLDGGGTAALYINGGYVVGPGRPLANAILLIK